MSKEYIVCEFCGCDSFIRTYNVYNIEVKVRKDFSEETIGLEKDHFMGYICKECRKDSDYLNE